MSWRTLTAELPIHEHLSRIGSEIFSNTITLLEAPPGSGKTTILPLFLAEIPWLASKKIIILQPRRVAARSVAAQMARLLGEELGETVGYSVRMESSVSPQTRIEVVTEGILARRIISNPELPGVGLIIFDEFHERSIHADLALGLVREVIASLRPDLKALIMSATLGETALAPALRGVGRYSFDGEPHPLTITHTHPDPHTRLWDTMAMAIRVALRDYEGDVLAFLPGRYEIERTDEALRARTIEADILQLYGEQPLSEQQRALRRPQGAPRRVLLATPIAETSLTIEGVRVVIDSGLHKVARVDANGFSSLSTERITQDAATQRAGRAARTAPGVCVRLWSDYEHRTLRPHREPEVLRTDLAPSVLDLAAWGVTDPAGFGWISPPTGSQLAAARRALLSLGAIDGSGRITQAGSLLSGLGLHPRLAQMCVKARELRSEETGAALVAVLEERLPRKESADILPLLSSRSVTARQSQLRKLWAARIKSLSVPHDLALSRAIHEGDIPAYLLACAYPDRIAQRRDDGQHHRYLLAGGGGAELAPRDPLKMRRYLAVSHLQGDANGARILGALALNESLLESALAELTTNAVESRFDQERGSLVTLETRRLGAIVLRERPMTRASPEEAQSALLKFLATPGGFSRLSFSRESSELQARVAWLRGAQPDIQLPDISHEALRTALESWLAPFLLKGASLGSVTPQLLAQAIESILSWEQRNRINAEAPQRFTLPGGRERPIHYSESEGPWTEVLLQDLFGVITTPVIGRSRTPLTLHLLSPARRPVQVTRDLASFWSNGYLEVRKELRGRYPKHRWPEDPTQPLPPKK